MAEMEPFLQLAQGSSDHNSDFTADNQFVIPLYHGTSQSALTNDKFALLKHMIQVSQASTQIYPARSLRQNAQPRMVALGGQNIWRMILHVRFELWSRAHDIFQDRSNHIMQERLKIFRVLVQAQKKVRLLAWKPIFPPHAVSRDAPIPRMLLGCVADISGALAHAGVAAAAAAAAAGGGGHGRDEGIANAGKSELAFRKGGMLFMDLFEAVDAGQIKVTRRGLWFAQAVFMMCVAGGWNDKHAKQFWTEQTRPSDELVGFMVAICRVLINATCTGVGSRFHGRRSALVYIKQLIDCVQTTAR